MDEIIGTFSARTTQAGSVNIAKGLLVHEWVRRMYRIIRFYVGSLAGCANCSCYSSGRQRHRVWGRRIRNLPRKKLWNHTRECSSASASRYNPPSTPRDNQEVYVHNKNKYKQCILFLLLGISVIIPFLFLGLLNKK
jgi:hypothetical protein